MDKIRLKNMEFFAHHGFYDEEQKIGNKYSVTVTLYLDLKTPGKTDRLADTVSYEHVYNKVKSIMAKPHRLLETIGNSIALEILEQFVSIKKCKVLVSKFNPPIGGICEKSEIEISRKRK